MELRRFLKLTSVFILAALVPLFFLSRFDNLDRYTNPNPNIKKLWQKSQFDSLHFLFIGSSYTYSGVDVGMFDSLAYRTYNLGIATSGPYFYELLINDYLNGIQSVPQYVFVLFSPMSFCSRADNFGDYPIHRYLDRPFSNEKIAQKYTLFRDYFSMEKHSVIKAARYYFLQPTDEKNSEPENYRNNGFFPSEKINDEKTPLPENGFYKSLSKEKFNVKKYDYMVRYFNTLKEKGIAVVYYELPDNYLRSYFSASYLHDYYAARDHLKLNEKFLESYLLLENRCFRNTDHLNSEGAHIATEKIIAEMTKMGIITKTIPLSQ